ncbi:MAG: ABC transporter permease [Gemmatimonadetes bacterium]|nr:MAG: ABC transporter permease [Gemmatimonadota bacterium]
MLFFERFVVRHHLGAKNKNALLSFAAWIATGGVFVGVATLLVTLAVMTGFQTQFRDSILAANSHLYILEYFSDGMTNVDQVTARLEDIPQVESISPFIYAKAMILNGDQVDGVAVRGIDPQAKAEVFIDSERLVAGEFNLDSDPDPKIPGRMLVGVELARKVGVAAGDTIVLAYPLPTTPNLSRISNVAFKMRRFIVSGIFDSGLYDYNATLCYLSIPTAQDFFELGDKITGLELRISDIYEAPLLRKSLNGIHVRLTENEWNAYRAAYPAAEAPLKKVAKRYQDRLYFDTDRLTDAQRDQIGESALNALLALNKRLDYPYRATDWTEMNEQIFELLNLQKLVMFLILTLIIIVAAFNVVSTLIMIVMEKTREIGILKAMGTNSQMILRIFIMEGLVIGIIGTLLGGVGGYLIALSLKRWKFVSLAADVYQLDHLPVQVVWSDPLLVFVTAIIISFLATLYPAWQAAKLMPVEAIRYDE